MKKSNNISSIRSGLENHLANQKSRSQFENKLEAGLIISEIDNIDVNRACNEVNQKIGKRERNIQLFTRLTRFAAILTIPLLMLTIWSLFLLKEPAFNAKTELTWYELQTPAGMRSQVILPDGTRMWLNAESKLRYSIPFVRNNRSVELSGEAYLEVVKNESSPFRVVSGKTVVEVLGTKFNIKSYSSEKEVSVALREGSVKFTYIKSDNRAQNVQLKSGENLILDKDNETIQVNNSDLEKIIAWHTNTLILDDTPMEEVASLLERWYGVDVSLVGEELKKYQFTTTFENESLFQVLVLLELSSPIDIKYIPGKIERKSGNAERSNVIISKK